MRAKNAGNEPVDVLFIPPASAIEIFQDRGTQHIVFRELPFEDLEAYVLRLTPARARLVASHLVKLADRIEAETHA